MLDAPAAARIEDPDWTGERRGACRSVAARLGGLYERPAQVETSEVCRLPAVRGVVLLDVDEERTVRLEHVFVRAGERTYHVLGFSPLWEKEYAGQ